MKLLSTIGFAVGVVVVAGVTLSTVGVLKKGFLKSDTEDKLDEDVNNIIDIDVSALSEDLDFDTNNYSLLYTPVKVGRTNESYIYSLDNPDVGSKSHPFKLIVKEFDEKNQYYLATAEKIEGDNYFEKNDLSKWEIKFKLNKGNVEIIYLKDEFNNESNFDFKNFVFKRYKTNYSTSYVSYFNSYSDTFSNSRYSYTCFVDEKLKDGNDNLSSIVDSENNSIYQYCYMFGGNLNNGDASVRIGSSESSINVSSNNVYDIVVNYDIKNSKIECEESATFDTVVDSNVICYDSLFMGLLKNSNIIEENGEGGNYYINVSNSKINGEWYDTSFIYVDNSDIYSNSSSNLNVFYDVNYCDFNIHSGSRINISRSDNSIIKQTDNYFERNNIYEFNNSTLNCHDDSFYDCNIAEVDSTIINHYDINAEFTLYNVKSCQIDNLKSLSNGDRSEIYNFNNCKLENISCTFKGHYPENLTFLCGEDLNWDNIDISNYTEPAIYYKGVELSSLSSGGIEEVSSLPTENISTSTMYKVVSYLPTGNCYLGQGVGNITDATDMFHIVTEWPSTLVQYDIYYYNGELRMATGTDSSNWVDVSTTGMTIKYVESMDEIVGESNAIYIESTINVEMYFYHDGWYKADVSKI